MGILVYPLKVSKNGIPGHIAEMGFNISQAESEYKKRTEEEEKMRNAQIEGMYQGDVQLGQEKMIREYASPMAMVSAYLGGKMQNNPINKGFDFISDLAGEMVLRGSGHKGELGKQSTGMEDIMQKTAKYSRDQFTSGVLGKVLASVSSEEKINDFGKKMEEGIR
jgi:hypothetical protein